jgi:hypothetical protein
LASGQCLCAAVLIAILSIPAFSCTPAATTVGEFITTDTHWQLADSPDMDFASTSVLSGQRRGVDGRAKLGNPICADDEIVETLWLERT